MAKRHVSNGGEVMETAAGADLMSAVEQMNGTTRQNGPPYEANWLTIKAAAVRAGVSGQAVRKATEKFTELFDGKTFMAAPRDMFGNEIGRAMEYVDAAAIDAWLTAKAENPSKRGGRKSADGARNYTVRLTDDQLDVLQLFIADGTTENVEAVAGITFKRNERKPRVQAGTADETNSTPLDVAMNNLFDVDVA